MNLLPTFSKNPTKPRVFYKLLVFLTPGSREKVGLVETSKIVHPNNQNDSGTLLERYPEGHTRQGGGGKTFPKHVVQGGSSCYFRLGPETRVPEG